MGADENGVLPTRVETRILGLIATASRNAQTGTSYTAVASDVGKLIEMNNASLNTLVLPTMPAGSTLGILQYGAGSTTILPGSGMILRSRGNAHTLGGQYGIASAFYRTTTEVILGGDLIAIAPTDVANLGLWFRGSDLSGLADGTAINGNWSSLAGTSLASQATSGFRPAKQTVGGRTVVRFDGTDDKLALDGAALTVTQDVPGLTIFARVKLNALPSAAVGGIASFSVNGSTNTRAHLRTSSTGLWQAFGRRLDADSAASAGTLAADTSIHTVCTVFDYVNTDAFVFVDGAAAGSNTAFQTSGNTSNTVSNTARFGVEPNDASPTSMDLYEVVVYKSALNTANRQLIEAYLAGV
jgi:hypothetical protein